MINIDGRNFNADYVTKEFKQTADIINGDNSGRLQGNKDMYIEYVGTFFNHAAKIHRSKNCSDGEWDDLFNTLANPINKHTVSFPFGQNILTQQVYISKVERVLIEDKETKKWASAYDVTFTAMYSQWLAGQNIKGLS